MFKNNKFNKPKIKSNNKRFKPNAKSIILHSKNIKIMNYRIYN